MPALVVYNWKELFKEYLASGLQQKKWTELKGLSETNVSREFAAIRRARADAQIERAKLILASKAPVAASQMVSLINSEDENVSLKASDAILKAVGISPQAAAIQVNTKVETKVLIAPIFATQAAPVLDSFLGEKIADTESND